MFEPLLVQKYDAALVLAPAMPILGLPSEKIINLLSIFDIFNI
jgi:hypothetical protein